jgi:hypothetical protein
MGDMDFMAGVGGRSTDAAVVKAVPGADILTQNPYGDEESEYRAGITVVERFDKYHVRVDSLAGRVSADKGTPGIHFGVTTIHGPKGNTDKKVFFDAWLVPRRNQKQKDPITGQMTTVPLPPDKAQEAEKEFHLALNRLAKRLGLKTLRPTATDDESITEWLQPGVGKELILALGVEKSDEYGDKNKLGSLNSIGGPGDPVLDENGKATGKTLLDVSVEESKKADERKAKKAGKGTGQTAKGFGAPSAPAGGMFAGK